MTEENNENKLIVLLDSSGILHARFHACVEPRMGYIDGKALDVAATYAYLEYTRKLTSEIEYDHLIHILDPDGGSHFRFSLFPDYKANRPPTHPVLCGQRSLLKPILEGFGQNCIRINGVESDDVIATLAKKYADLGHDVLVVTQDKDLMQLVEDGRVALARYVDSPNGKYKTHEFYEEEDVARKFGVRADQVADFLALVGDTSDNIAGVKGVGEKTAAKWLGEYGTLASLITHADEIKGAVGDKLRSQLDDLPLYRKLTGVLRDVDVEPILENIGLDLEKNQWAKSIINPPDFWPDDLTSDLKEPVPENYNSYKKPSF